MLNANQSILIRRELFKLINLYVDDLFIAAKILSRVSSIKNVLKSEYEIKDFKKTRVIVEIKIIRNEKKRTFSLN